MEGVRLVDTLALRKALGQFATGVTVVSMETEDGVHGMTANSFTSVSLEPPLVLVCVDKRHRTHDLIPKIGRFAVNVLSEDQQDISNWYAGRRQKPVEPKWRLDRARAPILEGALAWFDCRLAMEYDGGDHTIYVGRVEDFAIEEGEGEPLLFFRGRYTRLMSEGT